MRALLARTVRPTIGHATASTQLSSSAIRKTVISPGRRKVTFNDAFTILLAPVFAFAFVFDATAKDRRRKEWDKKIAEVQEEIETLYARETRVWHTVQWRSIHQGVAAQRRNYSTDFRPTNGAEEKLALSADQLEPLEQAMQPQDDSSINRPADLVAWTRYESLIAAKLALEMLLHVRTGRSVLYRRPAAIPLDNKYYSQSLDDLAAQLHRINDALKEMDHKENPAWIPESMLNSLARADLHNHIKKIAGACQRGEADILALVHGYCQAITQFRTSPRAESYRVMMECFSMRDNDPLAYTAMGAIQSSNQFLSNKSIYGIIYQYGKFKDAGRFTKFLKVLSQKQGHLIYSTRWEEVKVNGVNIIAPRSRDPQLLLILIRAALQCDMAIKAEAWATLFFQSAQESARKRFAYVFRSIINYYAHQKDWRYGIRWAREAMKWLAAIAREAPEAVAKTLFRMLILCVECNQPAEYDKIMDAIVAAGIQAHAIRTDLSDEFAERAADVHQDWKSRVGDVEHVDRYTEASSLVEKAQQFQQKISEELPILTPYIGMIDTVELVRTTSEDPSISVTQPFGSTASVVRTEDLDRLKSQFLQLQNELEQVRNAYTELQVSKNQEKAKADELEVRLAAAKATITSQSTKFMKPIVKEKQLAHTNNAMSNKQRLLRKGHALRNSHDLQSQEPKQLSKIDVESRGDLIHGSTSIKIREHPTHLVKVSRQPLNIKEDSKPKVALGRVKVEKQSDQIAKINLDTKPKPAPESVKSKEQSAASVRVSDVSETASEQESAGITETRYSNTAYLGNDESRNHSETADFFVDQQNHSRNVAVSGA